MNELKENGYHLAFAATLRVLARHIAEIASPNEIDKWFTLVGQQTFDYIDRTSNPQLSKDQAKIAKEAAYDTLRMIFDPKGFEV